ncbi:MAG: hypothetical protein LBN93_12165 [Candidatus Symbiothrix sp.]|jgi:hypothetical protein|nr:hypothetical protein [Candidatus Symbiothrix sp.]
MNDSYQIGEGTNFIQLEVKVGTVGQASTKVDLESVGVIAKSTTTSGGCIPATIVGLASDILGKRLMIRTQIVLPKIHPVSIHYQLSGGSVDAKIKSTEEDVVSDDSGLNVTITKVIQFV